MKLKICNLCLIIFMLFSLVGCTEKQNGNQTINPPITDEEYISTENKKATVLYKGHSLDKYDFSIDIENALNFELKKYINEKYSLEYDWYNNGKFVEKLFSVPEDDLPTAYWHVPIAGEVGFYGNYDPYPRKYQKVDIDTEFLWQDILNRFEVVVEPSSVQAISIDLDGDCAYEYIICLNNKEQDSYFVALANCNFKLVAYMMAFKPSDKNQSDFGYAINYNLEEETEFIDIDGDGIMEIIIDFCTYEGMKVEVYKYNKGHFSGEFINYYWLGP